MLHYSQLHIALVALGMAAGTVATLRAHVPAALFGAVALGAWAAYVVERRVVAAPEDARLHPERVAWFTRHRRGLTRGVIGAGLGVMGALTRLPGRVLPVVAATALLGSMYVLWRPLRAHPLGKPLAIAGAWVLGGVVLPLMASHEAIPATGAGLYLIARLATVAANVVLCDLPDRRGDALAGRSTLAVRYGARGVRRVAATLLVLALVLDVAVLLHVPGPPGRALGLIGPLGLLGACVRLPRGGARERIGLDLLVGAGGLSALG